MWSISRKKNRKWNLGFYCNLQLHKATPPGGCVQCPTWVSMMHSAGWLLQTLLNWGPDWLWPRANPRGNETLLMQKCRRPSMRPQISEGREVLPERGRECTWAQAEKKACMGCWCRLSANAGSYKTAGTWGDQSEVIHNGRHQKKRHVWAPPPEPEAPQSVPAECMMFTKMPQPCKRDKILNELKSDHILAFQMSLLIFPPFRTAKSLHGCF